ncbi:MAG TPA: L,D-transpeptidase [Chthoniobacterales bacterium]|jgi:lipoprotein-anchoring transpeptidase ErfK/SrfK
MFGIRISLLLLITTLSAAAQSAFFAPIREAVVSVPDQKMVVMEGTKKVATFPISTSRFGVGDRHNSWSTPSGTMRVAKKIGDRVPPGAVFRRRQPTGEILPPNAPGRDPIVTRILWLSGTEPGNQNAFERCIYIHGTTEEKMIGKPVSFGCIRMKSKDVIVLYEMLSVGSRVSVVNENVKKALNTVAMAKLQPMHMRAVPLTAPR